MDILVANLLNALTLGGIYALIAIGYTMVYGIIKQTGGFIFVDSTPGDGTCFMLILPALDPLARQAEPEAGEEKAAQKPRSGVVLLVEDEAPVRAFASRALQLRGFTVLEADTGEAALEVLEDEETRIDVFVTDVVMPGLDGPGLLKEARHLLGNARIVFISGYAKEEFSDTLSDDLEISFLPKPFDIQQLAERVKEELAARQRA